MERTIICSVGDLMVSDSPLYVSVGFGSLYKQNKGKVFSNCKHIFKEADIVIGNLESVLHEPTKNSLKEMQMSCKEQVIKEIQDAGFNIINIANNHCLQHGNESFYKTIQVCRRNNIECIGEKNSRAASKTVGGQTFFFLSICLFTEFYQKNDIRYEDSIKTIIHNIQAIREKNQTAIIVLSIHWGDEFATYPSPTQVQLAHLLIECGTNIILGHHSHVFQGIEEYQNGLIVYSQGNFISDMIPELCRNTAIIAIEISEPEGERQIKYHIVPYYIDDNYIPMRTDSKWFDERQHELQRVIDGETTDAEYKEMVHQNHKTCHALFREMFIKGRKEYNKDIYLEMLYSFIKRKIQRKIGAYPKRYDLDQALCIAKETIGR